MDILKMLIELREERDNIDEAILLLSRLASQGPASRPPTQVARVRAEPKQAWPSARSEKYCPPPRAKRNPNG